MHVQRFRDGNCHTSHPNEIGCFNIFWERSGFSCWNWFAWQKRLSSVILAKVTFAYPCSMCVIHRTQWMTGWGSVIWCTEVFLKQSGDVENHHSRYRAVMAFAAQLRSRSPSKRPSLVECPELEVCPRMGSLTCGRPPTPSAPQLRCSCDVCIELFLDRGRDSAIKPSLLNYAVSQQQQTSSTNGVPQLYVW